MLRRSSTSRSIGQRSSFASTQAGDESVSMYPFESSPRMLGEGDTPGVNEQTRNYVHEQVEFLARRVSVGVYEDEFKAGADEQE